jgi:5'-nucleotidase
VKLAFNQILRKKPDLLVSGINHGSNSATSVIYSGTMAAALEGCVNEVPSMGFSFLNVSPEANFETAVVPTRKIIEKALHNGMDKSLCLNVNIPDVSAKELKGIKICRQNLGFWQEEFDKRTDPHGKHYFWLTGEFLNTEPDAEDTDEWALNNNYVSVVPVKVDLTSYEMLQKLLTWEL